jgi:hypothetical protein
MWVVLLPLLLGANEAHAAPTRQTAVGYLRSAGAIGGRGLYAPGHRCVRIDTTGDQAEAQCMWSNVTLALQECRTWSSCKAFWCTTNPILCWARDSPRPVRSVATGFPQYGSDVLYIKVALSTHSFHWYISFCLCACTCRSLPAGTTSRRAQPATARSAPPTTAAAAAGPTPRAATACTSKRVPQNQISGARAPMRASACGWRRGGQRTGAAAASTPAATAGPSRCC